MEWSDYLKESVTKEQLEQIAAEKKCELIVPKSNEVFIDIDTLQQREQLFKQLVILDDNGIDYDLKEWKSKSGNTHYVVRLPFELSDALRVAFQAALGSDPKRELLACLRILANVEVVTALFRPILKELPSEPF